MTISRSMGVESIESIQGDHSAILSTFIKLSFVFKFFIVSILEWQCYTGFTVCIFNQKNSAEPDQMTGSDDEAR